MTYETELNLTSSGPFASGKASKQHLQQSKNHSKFLNQGGLPGSENYQQIDETSFRQHTKRSQNLDGSYSARQGGQSSNMTGVPGHQKPTSSTSVTRRQQELSNARLFAGARASVTLKASLQYQQ